MSNLHLIYIPGLGDQNPVSQRKVVGFWRRYGVAPELFQMNWADNVPWQTKFERLLSRIDELAKNGPVALVGASAGAGAAINAYAARSDKIAGVVCLAGKINHPEGIGDKYRRANPSFIESAYLVPESLDKLNPDQRQRILCRYAIFDGVVPKNDSKISGARNRLSPTFVHSPTIAFQLIFGAPSLIRFLKKQAQNLK